MTFSDVTDNCFSMNENNFLLIHYKSIEILNYVFLKETFNNSWKFLKNKEFEVINHFLGSFSRVDGKCLNHSKKITEDIKVLGKQNLRQKWLRGDSDCWLFFRLILRKPFNYLCIFSLFSFCSCFFITYLLYVSKQNQYWKTNNFHLSYFSY